MSEIISSLSVTFNLAEFHVDRVKYCLNRVESHSSRDMKIKEIMDASNKAESAIVKLKELQSELLEKIKTI